MAIAVITVITHAAVKSDYSDSAKLNLDALRFEWSRNKCICTAGAGAVQSRSDAESKDISRPEEKCLRTAVADSTQLFE